MRFIAGFIGYLSWVAVGVLFATMVLDLSGIVRAKPGPRKEPTAYCIDPWASRDMRTTVYTPCSLVPRRYKA